MPSKAGTAVVAAWAIVHPFLYGFHITALNGVQDAVMCQGGEGEGESRFGLNGCLDLSDAQFGVVVSILTLGGLVGSLGADLVTRRFGRVGTLRISEVLFCVGAALVGLANQMWLMIAGRVLVGVASGLVLVTIPLYLNEIASEKYKTLFGTLHQIAIGIGMMVAQTLSIPFGRPLYWRLVLVVGFGLAVVVLLGGLVKKNDTTEKEDGDEGVEEAGEESPLLDREREKPLSVKELFTTDDSGVRRALLVVIVAQFSQQICGISPVMFFSTRILMPVFQAQSKLVALAMMGIGIPFNFMPGFLPESFGTRRLLLISAAGAAIFSVLLAFGLNMHQQVLSSVGIIGFVVSFSVGLAPLAWVVLSEVMPPKARTSGGAIGVSVNWSTNFGMGAAFLPLQEALKQGEQGEGNIFFFTAATSALAFVGILVSYRVYNRGSRE